MSTEKLVEEVGNQIFVNALLKPIVVVLQAAEGTGGVVVVKACC